MTDLCMLELQQKVLKTKLGVFVYHTSGTTASTKIHSPGIRHKKQIQGVNSKPDKNSELKEIFQQKGKGGLFRTVLGLFISFQYFTFLVLN